MALYSNSRHLVENPFRYTVNKTNDRESSAARAILMKKYCPETKHAAPRGVLEGGNADFCAIMLFIYNCHCGYSFLLFILGELREINRIVKACPHVTTEDAYRAYKVQYNCCCHPIVSELTLFSCPILAP